MSDLRFEMLVLGVALAGVFIAAIYLFMLAVPRNDEEHLHDSIGEPGHMKTHFLRAFTRARHNWSRLLSKGSATARKSGASQHEDRP